MRRVKRYSSAVFRTAKRALVSAAFFLTVTLPAYAEELDIKTGLEDVDKAALATKIRSIGLGVGSLIGVVAVCAMIFCGFRLATAKDERSRADAISHMMWAIGAVVVVGLAMAAVGFVANLVSGS